MPTETTQSHELFVTTQQAARLLGVSVRTVQLWVENGVLQAWKTAGGHRRIARASVDELREQQREVIQTVAGMGVLKILVIEDDPLHLELYKMKIAAWQRPATVIGVKDGFEALIAVGRTSPHVVITDVRLPAMNGFDMVRALVAKGGLQIIVVTGLTDAEIAAAGGLPDSVRVLKKPIDFGDLEEILK